MNTICDTSDLLVFSHLRWDFVFQRPQHILSRYARFRRVFYVEEPIFGVTDYPRLHLRETPEKVQVVVPYLPEKTNESDMDDVLRGLIEELIIDEAIVDYSVLHYSPMAMGHTRHLKPKVEMFDYMSETPVLMIEREKELMARAQLIFIGGRSLYEQKKDQHSNIHAFPNSIDYEHFIQARYSLVEPDDQMNIPHPRIGYYGVIDERFNAHLLEQIADLRPEFQFIIVGPVMNIDPATLPLRNNIHYLGKKEYHALPLYLSGWDCAMMLYHLNDSTRYINPTKTPEFLAAGKPVVATSVADIIHPYSDAKLVYIADHPEHFVECIEKAMNERSYDPEWLERVDTFLEGNSWDLTFIRMAELEMRSKVMASKPARIPAYQDETLSAIGIV